VIVQDIFVFEGARDCPTIKTLCWQKVQFFLLSSLSSVQRRNLFFALDSEIPASAEGLP